MREEEEEEEEEEKKDDISELKRELETLKSQAHSLYEGENGVVSPMHKSCGSCYLQIFCCCRRR